MPLETVQRKKCSQCLFTKNKIVSDQARDEILKSCKDNNNNFICHKATIKGLKVVCSGFYKSQNIPEISKMLEDLGEIEFVDID
jgi:hypothetical protein